MTDSAALTAVARGRVQGVYYRAFTSRAAIDFGLTGYVRNLPDNSVEIYAEGERNQDLRAPASMIWIYPGPYTPAGTVIFP